MLMLFLFLRLSHSLRAGTAIQVAVGCELSQDPSWMESRGELLLPSLSTHPHFKIKKKKLNLFTHLLWTSEVPWAHVFWVENPDQIWWVPKSPETPFYPPLLLQNCCCYSSSALVQRLAGTGTYPVWRTASGGGGWRKKSNYILCSIFPSAFFPLSYKP